MYELDQYYPDELEILAANIQDAEELAQYLESEEEEDYIRLKDAYEPQIALLYEKVAYSNPLQLIPFELVLLDPVFEGLFLPKLLGFSVLRGEITDQYHYVRPQEHFKEVLLAICNSPNFEILKKRIGQSIQMGFALSSDIWVTNFINNIENKRIRYFLQSQKLEKYRRDTERITGYQRYRNQFRHDNFMTAEFPTSLQDLPVLFSPLKHFLLYRAAIKADNSSLIEPIQNLVEHEELHGTAEHLQLMAIYAMYYEQSAPQLKSLTKIFNKIRQKMAGFQDAFLQFLLELHHHPELPTSAAEDRRMSAIVDKTFNDDLSAYYQLMDTIHDKGYINAEAQEAVKLFYNKHEGLSTINECVRQTIFHYFHTFISNLEETDYPEFFEISKLFPVYMGIFANQKFNQDLEDLSMGYVARLLKHYTDKRGKDYQDIKKFTSSTFVDFDFLKEKEAVEMFKTRRKKKAN